MDVTPLVPWIRQGQAERPERPASGMTGLAPGGPLASEGSEAGKLPGRQLFASGGERVPEGQSPQATEAKRSPEAPDPRSGGRPKLLGRCSPETSLENQPGFHHPRK